MVNANDKLFDGLVERQVNNLRLASGVNAKLQRDLSTIQRKLIEQINEFDLEGVAETAKSQRLRELIRETNTLITNDYRSINARNKREFTELARMEAAGVENLLQKSVGIEITTTSVPAAQINAIYSDALIQGAPSGEWWADQARNLRQSFAREMRQGLLIGETNQQLVQRIRGTRAFGFNNGIFKKISRQRAEALVRSSALAVANEARFQTFEANSDIIKSVRHSSVLDSRTSTICVVRDGKRWEMPSREPIGHNLLLIVPPVHWNCRSVLISEVEGANLADDATRSSVDGPVSAKTTFGDFLEGKSKKFQDELLGKGRADLWRNGDITLRQLLDTKGNPLTLTALKEKLEA